MTPLSLDDHSEHYVGRSIKRTEDDRLLAGRGRFVADLASTDTLHVSFVRSDQAHADIADIDVSEALALPGVVAVLTGGDLKVLSNPLPLLGSPEPTFASSSRLSVHDARLECLPSERVHYVGQPVALVAATSRRVAEDAAELVAVTYVPLPAVLGLRDALAPESVVLHRHLSSNEAASICISYGDIKAGRSQAHLLVSESYRVGRHGAVPLECRGVFARLDRRDRIEVWTSTQIPHLVREAICAVTGWDPGDVRVATPDVGGGFGTKANVYVEEIVVPVAARLLGRDLIWVEDRFEHLTSAAQARDQEHDVILAVDIEGRILSWEDDFMVDVGAGSSWTAGIVANTAIHLMGPYRIPAFRASGRAVFTNKAIVAQYRGAGRPEACFALERSLDRAADQLGISRAEIRLRNLLTRTELPYSRPVLYRDGVPISYDGGDYRSCLETCLGILPEAVVAELAEDHPSERLGYGVATYIEATGRGPWESGSIALTSSGRFEVAAGSAAAGQGHETTLAQIAADVLKVNPNDIFVRAGDTDAIGEGVGSFASRSAVTAGNAVHAAAGRLVELATELAAVCLDTTPEDVSLTPGGFVCRSGDTLSWSSLSKSMRAGARLAGTGPLKVLAIYEPPTVTWTMGAHAAVVAVDEETGICRVLRYAVAHEGGIEINPSIVEGQVVGGVAQGIGGALLEEFRYSEDGQPLSTTLADYLLPSSLDVPPIVVKHIAVETAANPLGIRGVGESGTIAAYAAVASAVETALGGRVRVTESPINPSQLAVGGDSPGVLP